MALGGASVILATATSGKSMTPLIGGLGVDGTLIVVGASPGADRGQSFQVIGDRRGVAAGRRAPPPIRRTRCASAR